jgi:hypothetical protein
MCAVRLCLINSDDDPFDFVSAGPLYITRMLVDTSYVLSYFGLDRLQDERVDRIQGV